MTNIVYRDLTKNTQGAWLIRQCGQAALLVLVLASFWFQPIFGLHANPIRTYGGPSHHDETEMAVLPIPLF
jgi:hypothetical protein